MSGFVNNIASSFAGVLQADKNRKGERRKEEETAARRRDIHDEYTSTPATVATEEVSKSDTNHRLSENTSEQTQEDRDEHVGYTHPEAPEGGRLDLSA